MTRVNNGIKWLSSLVLASSSLMMPAIAQVVTPDGTLSTVVTPSVSVDTNGQQTSTFTITAGDRAGDNLFHSFDEFSLPTGGRAVFSNANDIANIISRVTGGNRSTLDGTLSAAGRANLFLLNPDGIVFGPNAQLSIGGSFFGSTAESLSFLDGTEFVTTNSATNSINNPLLTMSAPIGLQFGASSRGIEVRENTGYSVISNFPPAVNSAAGLRVNPGQAFALVGNNINLNGGIIAAPAGRVSLVSVQSGRVEFDPRTGALNGDNVQQWGDIQLSNQALVDASGLPTPLFLASGLPAQVRQQVQRGGTIDIQAQQLSATEGSLGLSYNFSDLPAGSIQVTARDTIELSGTDRSTQISTGFITLATGAGNGADINLSAQGLSIAEGGGISSLNNGSAHGGDINLAIADNLLVTGLLPVINDGLQTGTAGSGTAGNINIGTRNTPVQQLSIRAENVTAQTAGAGTGGDINIYAEQLSLTDSGAITAASNASGDGGNVFISAQEIDILDVDPTALFPSGIGVSTVSSGNAGNLTIETQQLSLRGGARIDTSTFANGNAGILTIDTERLLLRDRARIDSSTFAAGDAGTLTINALESIDIRGTADDAVKPPSIASSGSFFDDPGLARFFTLVGVKVPTRADLAGNAGGVTINTPTLAVEEGAQITVRNDGPGDAGVLKINANQVQLSRNAGITASTQQGSGGNIVLNARESLLLRQNSRLSAEADGTGDGGNITLSAPVIVSTNNSDIIANANQGNGGNIQINTQALLLTSDSDITASSQFGVSGEVSVTNPEVDPSAGTVVLSAEIADSSQQIAAGCAAQTNQFVASGRGGLPLSPNNFIGTNSLWNDMRRLPATAVSSAEQPVSTAEASFEQSFASSVVPGKENILVEANRWQVNPSGDIILTEDNAHPALANSVTTSCLSSLGQHS